MPTVSDYVNKPEHRRPVVDDCARVVEEEVASKSGVTGLAVKAAFAMVKAVKPGIIVETCEHLLPEFAAALDPIVDARPAGQPLAAYLQSRTGEVVQALLGVTDARANRTTHGTLLKAYQKLRPAAEKHVAAALPRVSAMLQRHLDASRANA